MKYILAITIFVSLSALVASASNDWEGYKLKHGKTYSNRLQDAQRRNLFEREVKRVAEHNAKGLSYRLGLNHMSDWTSEEKKALMGFRGSNERIENSPEAVEFINKLGEKRDSVPAEKDWTKVEGVVTNVKNQSECGSCWAFATTGVLEGQQRIKNISLISLSEQNLVDCSKSNYGCNGGIMSAALSDVRVQGGIESEQSYPYKGKYGKCAFKPEKVVQKALGGAILTPGDEELLKIAVAEYGPVSVGIGVTDKLVAYKDGLYDDPLCGEINDHAVLVVGYGTDEITNTDYWIVKNSWSKDWGEDGYVRMARNKKNQCGISNQPTLAI